MAAEVGYLRQSAVLAVGLSLALTACVPNRAPMQSSVPGAPGTVELNQGAPDDALVGGSGTGTVSFHGQLYRFAVGGVGVDGAAVAVLQTSGEVLHLDDLASFPGVYRRVSRDSVAPGQSNDGLWLRNEHGTIMHLKVPPQGRMPDIGTDGLRVALGQ